MSIENSLVTQSRLILLDSQLVAATSLTVLAWTVFFNHQKKYEHYFIVISFINVKPLNIGLAVSLGLFRITGGFI